jgi:hypothetical protein
MNENTSDILHKIRAKLYRNYLPLAQGKYIARSTRNEAPLDVDTVCQSARNRGGYTGSVDELTAHVRLYHEECVFLLADGFAIKNKYFSLHPKIGGTFERADEAADKVKHPVEIVHHKRAALGRVFDNVEVQIEGVADADAYIGEVLDMFTGTVDETLTPGETIIIGGDKIKIGGDPDVTGLFFTNENGEDIQVPLNSIPENTNTKIIARIPDLAAGIWRVKIVTQMTAGTALKAPRTILYEVDLTVL